MKRWKSEGSGHVTKEQLGACGQNVVIEDGVRIFHPEQIFIGDNVYIGHNTILKGYYKHALVIDSNSWIGQNAFIHGAGGVQIGSLAGIGPSVRILASSHIEPDDPEEAILFSPLHFPSITIGENCNIGLGATIIGEVSVGSHSKIGANALVNRSIPAYSIAVGVPAKVIKSRKSEGTSS
ncbi:acyltransferase [Shouchella lonarensis]|uniref:Acetyltransferase (Isoleucine patch superfamily) n=1 Tax=Shouchella lonarensis TaxID=1464122 RepID=A0A1G6L7F3_9BACI|nr:DapH/DapD/GlmU-related protein [Shouchella lonarensis]SDC39164.1 Acetyltransferase (isoleucine patch superfamily) [Shouchella lonarensis]